LEHDVGAILTQLDAFRRLAQLELDLGQEIAWKGWNLNLKPGCAAGGNFQGFRGNDLDGDPEHGASADGDLEVIGGNQVAVGECLHHVLRRNRQPGDLVSMDGRAAFQAHAHGFRLGLRRNRQGEPHLVPAGRQQSPDQGEPFGSAL
jgi:hypothetical protein